MPYILLLAIMLLGATPLVSTAIQNDHPDAASNKAQAAQKAQQKVKGRVLKVEQRQTTFRVKLLQQSGRVVTIEIKRTVHHARPIQPRRQKVPR